MRVALFDMDRTLVRKNTAQIFVRYHRGLGLATWADALRVGYWVAQYTVGMVNAERVASAAVRALAGVSAEEMDRRCQDMCQRFVEPLVGPIARRVVDEHLRRGDLCAIVTSACAFVAKPIAAALGIPHVIATELECDARGLFTGNLIAPLCYGEGKITRATSLLAAYGASFEEAVFYSDSVSDLPLLARVRTPVAVNPDPRLWRIARARGYRIERW